MKVFKNVILVNGDQQLELLDAKSGETITNILHFGAYTDKLDEHIFKGEKALRVKAVNFEELVYNFCSPYGEENNDIHLILED
jgi:hypothetical protein